MTYLNWSNLTFTELMRHDPKKAFEYRFETTGTPIPDEYNDSIVKEEKSEKVSKKKIVA